jgi:F420H(2)-dependent quinone reductase
VSSPAAHRTRAVALGTVTTMPLQGEYEPGTLDWSAKQAALIESSGGTEGTELRGMAVIVVTSVGNKTGKLRKTPLMRVEHEGRYAAVGSLGGAPKHPVWYYNLVANPHVEVQDGPVKQDMTAREVFGEEKAEWWERAVAAFPNYADYQAKTERTIPLFVLEPLDT